MRKIYSLLLVFISLSFTPDEDAVTAVRNKAADYFKVKRTKLQLLFNQPVFAPGDTIRFNAAYFTAHDLKPVAGRQIVHICLFDQFGKKKLTRWGAVINGYASRELVVPKDFPSGIYKLVAFTDWMRNFDQSLFFQYQLTIADKFTINEVLPNDTLLFFPEGGSLAAGVENKLAVHYRGKSAQAKVSLFEGSKALATIYTVKDSVQIFGFKPEINESYFAELNDGNSTRRFALPSIKASAISFHVEATGSRLSVEAALSPQFKSASDDIYLAAFNNSGLVFQSRFIFNQDRKGSLLLPGSLPKGITQLILFDSKFNLLASRVIQSGELVKHDVIFSGLQDIYATRQEVNLNLTIKDGDGYSAAGFVSCRAVMDDLFGNSDPASGNYLTFQSDISNSFPLKERQSTLQTINNYLITQTCPWFNWDQLIKNGRVVFAKPQQDLSLKGTVTFSKNGKDVPDSTLVMFFLEKDLQGYETYTDSKGNFSFPLLLDVNHPDKFFYAGMLKGKDIDDISVKMFDQDSSLSFYASPWIVNRNLVDQYAAYSSQVQTINNSYSFFMNTAATRDSVEEPNRPIEDELAGADLTVNLSDFLMMPSMEDVVREILPTVEYRKIGGRQVFRVYTIGKITNYHNGPLFVIDGIITKDPAYFLSLKPADVISIKVVRDVKKLFPLGKLGGNGVILVKTKLTYKIVAEKHLFEWAGLLPETHGSRSGRNPQTPDLRSCLFWTSSHVRANEALKFAFKTSDDVGKFKFQVTGITEDGTPFYAEHPFQVKYSGN